MDYSSIIVVLVALLWGAATAAPARLRRDATTLRVSTPRWHQPCAGNTPADTTGLGGILSAITTPQFNATSDYQQIQEHAIVSREVTMKLMRNITVQRIKYDLEHDARDMRLNGLPVIPSSVSLNQDVATLLQHTYEWLMRFAVFLEAMGIDESIERRTHLSFHKEVKELEDNFIYWLLCKLKSTMQGHGIVPDTGITRDILEEYHTTEARAVRHLKGFLILRDLRNALFYIEGAFDVILSSAMDTSST